MYIELVPPNGLPGKLDSKEDSPCSILQGAIFVKNDHVYEKAAVSDILWIKAHGAYCKLTTLKKEMLLCINLSTFEKLVKVPYIVRIHRSYIINLHKIEAFEANYLHIQGELIPLGRKYKDCLARVFPYIEKTGVIIC